VILGQICGVGVGTSLPAEHRAALIQLMEGVEDIPGIVLTEGTQMELADFTDYLRAVEDMPTFDRCGDQIAHAPFARLCHGPKGGRHEVATDEEIGLMRTTVAKH